MLAVPLDPPGLCASNGAQIRSVLEHRRALLSHVASLIDGYRESNVLTFP